MTETPAPYWIHPPDAEEIRRVIGTRFPSAVDEVWSLVGSSLSVFQRSRSTVEGFLGNSPKGLQEELRLLSSHAERLATKCEDLPGPLRDVLLTAACTPSLIEDLASLSDVATEMRNTVKASDGVDRRYAPELRALVAGLVAAYRAGQLSNSESKTTAQSIAELRDVVEFVQVVAQGAKIFLPAAWVGNDPAQGQADLARWVSRALKAQGKRDREDEMKTSGV